MRKSVAVLFIALATVPSLALAQGRGNGRGHRKAQGIPPGHLPSPGECRVWFEGRPPGQQPPPTDCRSAERTAARTRDARVIYGDSRYRTDGAVDVYRGDDDRRTNDRDDSNDDDRRRDPRAQGRAIPRGSQYPAYPNGYPQARVPGDRYPEPRSQNHPGWTAGYRDGLVKGREDAGKNRSYDPQRHQWYRSASRGYESRYGLRGAYANIYREGFEAGYREEFRRTR
jgi:hypothetical protein